MPNSANQILYLKQVKLFFFAVLLLIVSCGGGSDATLRVFAASSLTEAFTGIARVFESENPGVTVDLDFGGSQRLRSQIEFGAKVDVFASADSLQMDILIAADLVFGRPVDFTSNRLVVIAATDGLVDSIDDLAKPGVRLVLAQASVPAGEYSRRMLANLADDNSLGVGSQFNHQVLANVVSEEPNVRFVAQKVALNEVDAGIVYQTDVATARKTGNINEIPIPLAANVRALYPMAVLQDAVDVGLAQSFLQFVLSNDGQRLLIEQGFTAP